ncbi:unnamed protein product [Oppiella nova]|uniref:Uncharacterized protein n=1 Tax=Oppiella nova TaxID=334625 RepID=A0A7R9MT94_9ACAR|nr:unnamed protein product [Oppiella nova]CAG2182899.1 unnamed protein product [Oppiella nova]
MMSWMTSKKT